MEREKALKMAKATRDLIFVVMGSSKNREWRKENGGTPLLVELFIPAQVKNLFEDMDFLGCPQTETETAIFTELILRGLEHAKIEMESRKKEVVDGMMYMLSLGKDCDNQTPA